MYGGFALLDHSLLSYYSLPVVGRDVSTREGGGIQKSFIREAPPRSPTPLPFYLPFFDRKGAPISHLVLTNGA